MKFSFILLILLLRITAQAENNSNWDSTKNNTKHVFPNSLGWVSDFENILSCKQEKKLSKIVKKFEKKTSNEIVIVTIESILPYDNLADFTTDLFNQWGTGKAGKDNGLVIVFSQARREVRVGTGYGTEKILTDIICKNIIDNNMIPYFKKQNYYKGLKSGIKELISNW